MRKGVLRLVLCVGICAVLCGAVMIGACGGNDEPEPTPGEHTHVAGTEWYSDETSHWNLCVAEGCTTAGGEIMNKASHTEAADWSETEDGSLYKACTVCGYVMETKEAEPEVITREVTEEDVVTFKNAIEATAEYTGSYSYYETQIYHVTSDGALLRNRDSDVSMTYDMETGNAVYSEYAWNLGYRYTTYYLADGDNVVAYEDNEGRGKYEVSNSDEYSEYENIKSYYYINYLLTYEITSQQDNLSDVTTADDLQAYLWPYSSMYYDLLDYHIEDSGDALTFVLEFELIKPAGNYYTLTYSVSGGKLDSYSYIYAGTEHMHVESHYVLTYEYDSSMMETDFSEYYADVEERTAADEDVSYLNDAVSSAEAYQGSYYANINGYVTYSSMDSYGEYSLSHSYLNERYSTTYDSDTGNAVYWDNYGLDGLSYYLYFVASGDADFPYSLYKYAYGYDYDEDGTSQVLYYTDVVEDNPEYEEMYKEMSSFGNTVSSKYGKDGNISTVNDAQLYMSGYRDTSVLQEMFDALSDEVSNDYFNETPYSSLSLDDFGYDTGSLIFCLHNGLITYSYTMNSKYTGNGLDDADDASYELAENVTISLLLGQISSVSYTADVNIIDNDGNSQTVASAERSADISYTYDSTQMPSDFSAYIASFDRRDVTEDDLDYLNEVLSSSNYSGGYYLYISEESYTLGAALYDAIVTYDDDTGNMMCIFYGDLCWYYMYFIKTGDAVTCYMNGRNNETGDQSYLILTGYDYLYEKYSNFKTACGSSYDNDAITTVEEAKEFVAGYLDESYLEVALSENDFTFSLDDFTSDSCDLTLSCSDGITKLTLISTSSYTEDEISYQLTETVMVKIGLDGVISDVRYTTSIMSTKNNITSTVVKIIMDIDISYSYMGLIPSDFSDYVPATD